MTHIVIIPVSESNTRKLCEEIEAQTFESTEKLIKLLKSRSIYNYFIVALTDFMDLYNDDELSVGESFLSYVKIL